MNSRIKVTATLAALFAGSVALAQTATSTPTEGLFRAPANETKVLGWSKNASLGANLSFSSSQDVVGQTDGSSQTYGLNLKGGLNRNSEKDEWRNSLSVFENTSRTPNIPRFVKSGDEAKLESMYLYSLTNNPELGPYVRGEAAAPLFKGEDVRPNPQNYQIINKNGTAGPAYQATSTHLTDGLKPLTTKESVGLFWKAVQESNIRVEARLGFGAMQIAADGQFAVSGTTPAGVVQVQELSDVSQAGLEAAFGVKGKIDDKSTYEVGVESLTPFINNKPADDDRDAFRLTNVDGFAKFNTNITNWAGLSYDYRMKLEPQLVDRVQQIHMVVLNLNYNLF